MRSWVFAVGALSLEACTTISSEPAVPAFADAATSARAAFAAARSQEADAYRTAAIRAAVSSGRITTQHCLDTDEASNCAVVVTIERSPVELGVVGLKLAAKADALCLYGETLRDLASAKDLTDEQAALQKMGKAAGAVFAAAGVPGVGAASDLAADLLKQARLAERREMLLKVTRLVDPAMAPLASELARTTQSLRDNIVLERSQEVADLQTRLLSAPPGFADRTALARSLFDAATQERNAAALKIDFSALPRAHHAMIQALENPKVDIKAAITETTVLTDELEATRMAFSPPHSSWRSDDVLARSSQTVSVSCSQRRP